MTVHIYWTIRRNTYSPGLLTSLLYAIVLYLLVRYGVARDLISGADFAIGSILGVVTVGAFLTFGPTWLFPNSRTGVGWVGTSPIRSDDRSRLRALDVGSCC